jgi:WD40 repeat protein
MQNPTLSKIVEWNPGNSNQFSVGYSGKLELLEIRNGKLVPINVKNIYTHPHAVQPVACTCLHWHPDINSSEQSIISFGTSTGQVSAFSWSTNEEVKC